MDRIDPLHDSAARVSISRPRIPVRGCWIVLVALISLPGCGFVAVLFPEQARRAAVEAEIQAEFERVEAEMPTMDFATAARTFAKYSSWHSLPKGFLDRLRERALETSGWSVATKELIRAGKVCIGMTEWQVCLAYGAPDSIHENQTKYAIHRHFYWDSYRRRGSVYLLDGKVVQISR